MNDGQAQVLNSNCIVCGACISSCPQQAKQYLSSIFVVERLLQDKSQKTAATIAPSFAASLELWQQRRMAGALRELGFDYVFEAACGAYYTAQESFKYIMDVSRAYVHTSCPAVINYITKYKPDLASAIAPVVSPMIGHARLLKGELGRDINIIFIGPCVAKKDELLRPEYKGLVAAALTFEEIFKMFKARGIDLKNCDETSFDKPSFYKSQYYPLPGGILKTLDAENKDLPKKILCIDGPANVKNALDNFEAQNCDIELMWCEDGCLNGPLSLENNIIKKRANIEEYARSNKASAIPAPKPEGIDLSNKFAPRPINAPRYSEAEIEHMLKLMGKEKEADRLNCGGCGYPSCRDKAVANLSGYAQKEMCMLYLRRRLNNINNAVIDSMPGGIVILDYKFNIVQTNARFNEMFRCSPSIIGESISLIADIHPFELVLCGGEKEINWLTEYPQYNLKCRFIVYNIKDANQLVGIFIPILNAQELSQLKSSMKMKALDKARELLKHQIETSQQIAKYLGYSTAQSQDIVNEIVRLTSQTDEDD
jgi:iron only hydrogenase large subunit-like protein